MKTLLDVRGMTCAHCEAAVRKALARVQGVRSVEAVDRTTSTAEVEGEPDVQALLRAVEAEGYEASVRSPA